MGSPTGYRAALLTGCGNHGLNCPQRRPNLSFEMTSRPTTQDRRATRADGNNRSAAASSDADMARARRAHAKVTANSTRPAAGKWPPELILALQRTVGNQRTASLLSRRALQRAPVAAPQLPPQTGLAAPAETTGFAVKAVEFVRGRPNATVAQLVGFMGTLTDQALLRAKVPPLTKHRQEPIAEALTAAVFEPWNWDMVVDVSKAVDPPPATVAGLTAAQVAALASSVYHESRHAEQGFRVAQVMARSEHENAVTIAAELRIPLNIAPLAVSSWAGTAVPTDPAAVAQTEGWRAFRGAGRHVDYRDYVNSIADDLTAVWAAMPSMKDVHATPSLRHKLDQREQLLIDTKIPERRKSFNAMFDKKMPTLDKAHVPVDADVEQQLGQLINVAMTDLFHAARMLRKLQASHAPAGDIDIAEQELQDKLRDAMLAAMTAEAAFPGEQDAEAAASAVATAVSALYAATGAARSAGAGAAPTSTRPRSPAPPRR